MDAACASPALLQWWTNPEVMVLTRSQGRFTDADSRLEVARQASLPHGPRDWAMSPDECRNNEAFDGAFAATGDEEG